MDAPKSFKDSLETQFNGRLRIRWSNKNSEWQIEEKISRGHLLNRHIDDMYDDEALRWRDGYSLVCSVRPGDRMPCSVCNTELSVPIHEFAEIRCPYCSSKGRKVSIIAGFFPLGDILLEHLRRLDPLRGWRDENVYEIYDEWRQKQMDKEIEDMSPIWGDYFKRLVGISQTGYTGKEKY